MLIIDDEPIVISVIRRLLRDRCEIHTATDASSAISFLRSGDAYDAILLDVRRPIDDAADLLAFLRDERPALGQRVILMSESVEACDEARRHAPLATVLVKPFSPAELLSALAPWLGPLPSGISSP